MNKTPTDGRDTILNDFKSDEKEPKPSDSQLDSSGNDCSFETYEAKLTDAPKFKISDNAKNTATNHNLAERFNSLLLKLQSEGSSIANKQTKSKTQAMKNKIFKLFD